MRFVLLGLVGLLPLAAATAQPRLTPDDAARVDRILDALQVERQMETSMGRMADTPVGAAAVPVMPAAVRAAVRDRLVAGYTRERADAVLAAIADGRHGAFLDQLLTLQDPALQASIFEAFLSPPKKGTLGDSLTAVRFVRASGLLDYTQRMLAEMYAGVAERVPAAREELAQAGSTPERMAEEQTNEIAPMYVLGFRVAARQSTPDATTAALAFAESDEGRYVSTAVFDGMRAAYVPVLIDALIAMLAGLSPDAAEAPPLVVEGPLPGDAEIYEEVEQEPVLVGGLEGLAGRLTYPEGARLANVEGTVFVGFVVDETGAVRDLEILRSPDPRLSEAALAVVRESQFVPGRHEGQPVKVRFVLPIRFALQ